MWQRNIFRSRTHILLVTRQRSRGPRHCAWSRTGRGRGGGAACTDRGSGIIGTPGNIIPAPPGNLIPAPPGNQAGTNSKNSFPTVLGKTVFALFLGESPNQFLAKGRFHILAGFTVRLRRKTSGLVGCRFSNRRWSSALGQATVVAVAVYILILILTSTTNPRTSAVH